jgi:hypothetical protein
VSDRSLYDSYYYWVKDLYDIVMITIQPVKGERLRSLTLFCFPPQSS